jgi:DNA-directed RNA polymerase specialized sigma24 family protein
LPGARDAPLPPRRIDAAESGVVRCAVAPRARADIRRSGAPISPSAPDDLAEGGAFPATRESLVAAVASGDAEVRERALGAIVAAYWKPVYKYLRLSWRAEREDAEDLTQGFFAHALEHGTLARYDASRSRFRSFVRVCLDGFVSNERKAERRLKRGGGHVLVPLDFPGAEREVAAHPAPLGLDPEELFAREWRRAFFAAAVDALRERCEQVGKPVHFAIFAAYDLPGDDERPTYAALAAAHGIPVTQVTNWLAWTRRELRGMVLARLRELSGSDEEYRESVRELLGGDAS